jgi:CpeS-like protein
MDIVEFFQLSAGKWSAIKSSHDLISGQQVAHKASLQFDWLAQAAPEVITLCEQHQINPILALGGLRLSWEDVTELGKKKVGNGVLVAIADATHPNAGTFLQIMGTTPRIGRYSLDNDKLSLLAESDDFHAEEHLWFESDNVRLRNSIVKNAQGQGVAAFYSEVRLMGAPPQV